MSARRSTRATPTVLQSTGLVTKPKGFLFLDSGWVVCSPIRISGNDGLIVISRLARPFLDTNHIVSLIDTFADELREAIP
jgi:hypothetical protein